MRKEEQALKDALLNNPDAEVLIQVDNDYAICSDFSTTCTNDYGVYIEELRLCEDDGYKDMDDYIEYLEEETDMTDEQINERINEAKQNNEFKKFIVISVG